MLTNKSVSSSPRPMFGRLTKLRNEPDTLFSYRILTVIEIHQFNLDLDLEHNDDDPSQILNVTYTGHLEFDFTCSNGSDGDRMVAYKRVNISEKKKKEQEQYYTHSYSYGNPVYV